MAKLKPLKTDEETRLVPADQPVLVELGIPDEEDGDKTEVVTPKPEEKTEIDPGVKTLQEQLAAAQAATKLAQDDAERERKARAESDRRAQEEARRARDAQDRVVSAEDDAVTSGLARAQQERDAAKAAVKMAFEAGNSDQLADAQERLGRAAADIRMYERAAADLAQQKEEAKRQPEATTDRQPTPEEAIESNPNLMAAEKTWLKSHMDSVVDPSRNRELGVAYDRATKKGLTRGSEAYFKFIEEFMGYKQPAPKSETEESEVVAAAPVTRNERGGDGQITNGRVMLSPEERDIAKSMGVSDIEYARQKVAFDAARRADPERYSSK